MHLTSGPRHFNTIFPATINRCLAGPDMPLWRFVAFYRDDSTILMTRAQNGDLISITMESPIETTTFELIPATLWNLQLTWFRKVEDTSFPKTALQNLFLFREFLLPICPSSRPRADKHGCSEVHHKRHGKQGSEITPGLVFACIFPKYNEYHGNLDPICALS
jgi:hypothetical protein